MYTGHCSSGATHNGERQSFLNLVHTENPFMIPQVYCPYQYHFLPSFRQRWALLGWTGISLGTAGFSSSMVVVPETLNWEREQSSRRRTGSRCLESLPKKSSIKVRCPWQYVEGWQRRLGSGPCRGYNGRCLVSISRSRPSLYCLQHPKTGVLGIRPMRSRCPDVSATSVCKSCYPYSRPVRTCHKRH